MKNDSELNIHIDNSDSFNRCDFEQKETFDNDKKTFVSEALSKKIKEQSIVKEDENQIGKKQSQQHAKTIHSRAIHSLDFLSSAIVALASLVVIVGVVNAESTSSFARLLCKTCNSLVFEVNYIEPDYRNYESDMPVNFEYKYAILTCVSDEKIEQEQSIYERFLKFEDLEPNTIYTLTIKTENDVVVFTQNYSTASESIYAPTIIESNLDSEGILTFDVDTAECGREIAFYTISVFDSNGKVLATQDATERTMSFNFAVGEKYIVYILSKYIKNGDVIGTMDYTYMSY